MPEWKTVDFAGCDFERAKIRISFLLSVMKEEAVKEGGTFYLADGPNFARALGEFSAKPSSSTALTLLNEAPMLESCFRDSTPAPHTVPIASPSFSAGKREKRTPKGTFKAVLELAAIFGFIFGGSYLIGVGNRLIGHDQSKPESFWTMQHPLPDDGVRLWMPVEWSHDKCDKTPWTEAVATAFVYDLVNRINEHQIHYHLSPQDGELRFDEFTLDNEGERRLRPPNVHYHIIYTRLEPAKALIDAVKAHQHGEK